MKNLIRLLIVGLLLVGLSGVGSAETVTITHKGLVAKITLPEGYVLTYYDRDFGTKIYEKDGSPIIFELFIGNIDSWLIDEFVGKYPLDDADLRTKEFALTNALSYRNREKNKIVVLNNGHKAVAGPVDTGFTTLDVKDGIGVLSYSMGKQIFVSGISKEMISVEDKRIIYQVLMSLDF